MSESEELLTFSRALENDITAGAQPSVGNPGDFREDSFTRLLSDELDAAGILESPTVCHLERGKGSGALKVNGYSIPDEDSRLDLFVTLYYSHDGKSVPTINAADVTSAFGRVERFLERSIDGLHKSLDPAFPEYHMSERIAGLLEKIDRVNYFIFTNAKLTARKEKERKPTTHGIPAFYDVWDIERFRRLRESGASYEALNVDLRAYQNGGLPCVRLDGDDNGYRTCVAIFPGILLSSLYNEHGSRLLELNVRSYLQAKGKINKGILETLRRDPADFMAFNNGITVVSESITFGDLSDGRLGIHEIKGMQIVNGGQTTASIHRAEREFGADLSKVYIQAKIVTVDPDRFNTVVPLISKYSNTQNKVSEPDLQANHPFHIGIERVSRREWSPDQRSKWFYERARGSYQTARTQDGKTDARRREFDARYPLRQRIEKEDLARFENCWRSLPDVANRGRQKSFTSFMTMIKDELGVLADTWEPSVEEYHCFIAKAILYRDVQTIIKSNADITAYAINMTNFTVSMIAQKTARRIDLEAIWKLQCISKPLASLTTSWAAVIFNEFMSYANKQTVHIDTTLKSHGTWEHLLTLDLKIPKSVEAELTTEVATKVLGATTTHHKGVRLSMQELDDVKKCVDFNQNQWMAIVTWGQGSRKLNTLQMGVATTLAAYAAQGWARPPSPKQAKHGVAMINAARLAGVIT